MSGPVAETAKPTLLTHKRHGREPLFDHLVGALLVALEDI
jgi:hypothetical protein